MGSSGDAAPGVVRTAIRWGIALGASGFAAGFVGPMVLDPEANIGPIVGILMTGPGGLIAGLVLGAIAALLPLSVAARSRALALICLVSVAAILYELLPEPAVRGYVIEATVASCAEPSQRLDEMLATWEAALKRASWVTPPANWKEDATRNVAEAPGVVLTLHVERKLPILRHRRPWDRGATSAGAWVEADESHAFYDATNGSDCAAYLRRPKALYWPQVDPDPDPARAAKAAWPPTDAAHFLQLQALGPVPEEYRRYLP